MNNRTIAAIALVACLLIAGCGGTSETTLEEEADTARDSIEQQQALRTGEAMGVDQGDEHWQILVTDVDENHVNLSLRKIVADEVGQNKEGIDPTYTFNRTYVEAGDLEFIEPHMKVAVLGIEDEEAVVVYGDWKLSQDDVENIIEYQNQST